MKEKNLYETPETEIVLFGAEDVIITSDEEIDEEGWTIGTVKP